jgi:hypothetical protein
MTTRRYSIVVGFLFCGLLLAVAAVLSCDTAALVKTNAADDDAADDDDNDDDNDDNVPPSAPTVQPPLTPTTLAYQSMRGTADPGVTINVTGGAANAQTNADDKGNFCVLVTLNTTVLNTLSFTAVNAANKTSPATTVKIQQEIVNFSLAGVASASSVSHSEPADTPDKAIDNNYLTWWRNTTQSIYPEACYVPQWLAVKLQDVYWLTEIDVYWGRDSGLNYEYGTLFDVYVNGLLDPAMPPQNQTAPAASWWTENGYTLVKHVQQATGQNLEKNTFDLQSSPVQARWILLALYQSNQPGLIWTCSGNRGLFTFGVAELQSYGYATPDQACP